MAGPIPITHKIRSQRGGAWLVMLVILVMGITTVFVTSLSSTAVTNRRNQTTDDALARAKEALIGYAVTYGDTHTGKTHGYLPCPDSGSLAEGTAPSDCAAVSVNELGRLPWRTLDLPALFDGAGECLWYAVSGNYSNKSLLLTMNWDTPVQLHVYGSDGNEIAPGEIVAVVIAPGSPVSGNADRAGAAAPSCGGNYTPAAYLDNDAIHNIDNSNMDNVAPYSDDFILPHEHRDANGNVTLTVNDQFIYITRQDIWYAIENRIAREVRNCLAAYAAASGGKYPWAVPVDAATYIGSLNTRFGRISDAPNRKAPYSTSDPKINDMFDYLDALQTALDNFAANNTPATRSALATAGDNLHHTAGDILNAGTYPSDIEHVATPAKSAGRSAVHLAVGDSGYTIAGVKTGINDARAAIDVLPTTTDATMQAGWQGGCFDADTFHYWNHWKKLVFYQIAKGYQPGSSAACLVGGVNSCLSLNLSDQAQTGSGSYPATVVIAGKKLGGGARVPATIGDYLETPNRNPSADNTQPYQAYRMTDSSYQTINDRVLCVASGVCN